MVRIGLVLLGLVLVWGGFEAILWPEILFSEVKTRAPRAVECTMAVGAIGYGALLALPPKALAQLRWLVGLLAGLVVLFAGALLCAGPSGELDFTRIPGVLVRVSPAALALFLVWRERKRSDEGGSALDPPDDDPLVANR
jgi:hypothetical protein